MSRSYDKVRYSSVTDTYYFIDTSTKDYYKVVDSYAYPTVSISNKSKGVWYPIVYDDFTVQSGEQLTEILYQDVPVSIKRKFTNWEKCQH